MSTPLDPCTGKPLTWGDPNHPCAPGPFDSPICYVVPPSDAVQQGVRRITLNPDCTVATSQILNQSLAVVPGAVEVGCPDQDGCCTTSALCGIFQGLATQVPAAGDTALFVTPAGCFLGVPGGGGGGFPGYGSPVTIGTANADGVSLLVARADHVHAHGDQPGGTLHALATTLVAGFMSPADKAKLDGLANVTFGAIVSVDAAPNVNGLSTDAARADHKHEVLTGPPVATAQANAPGTALTLARSDHVHRTIVQVLDDGTLAGSRPTLNFVSGLNMAVTAIDDGVNDRVNITFDAVLPVTGFAIPSVPADADPPTAGVATTAIRSDAKLQVATAAPPANTVDAGAPAAGTASTLLRSDAKLQALTGTPVATAQANAPGTAISLARSDHVHRTIVQSQLAGVLTSSRPTLNFIGANVTVADDAVNDRTNITIAGPPFIQRFTFQADQFDNPVNANWAVNALAPAAADSLNPALVVRRFDDTLEEGVGGIFTVPPGATSVNFLLKWRAQTAPASTAGVAVGLYHRHVPNNAAVTAWSAVVALATLSVPTNTNFQYSTVTLTLASLGWTVNTLRQFELTRRGALAADTLVGDWDLLELIVEFV